MLSLSGALGLQQRVTEACRITHVEGPEVVAVWDVPAGSKHHGHDDCVHVHVRTWHGRRIIVAAMLDQFPLKRGRAPVPCIERLCCAGGFECRDVQNVEIHRMS